MRFDIAGVDRKSGTERNLVIEAENESAALNKARAQGVLPYRVSPVPDELMDSTDVSPSPASPSLEELEKQAYVRLGIMVGAIFFAAVCVVWALQPSGSSSYAPTRRSYVPPPSSEPVLYPSGKTRDWSKSEYRHQSVGGYHIPTDPSLRKQYFDDMKAENERLERELIDEGLLVP